MGEYGKYRVFEGKKAEALDILKDKNTETDDIYGIFLRFKGDSEVESAIAMALSVRTSVYDKEKGRHEKMEEMLRSLSESEDMQARWAVAKNPHTPEDILIKLSKDEVNLVRALTAANPNTPKKILAELFNDEKIVRDGLTGNPNTPLKLLKLFINENDRMARLRLAENKGVSKEILSELLKDDDKDVRTAAKIKLKERFDEE